MRHPFQRSGCRNRGQFTVDVSDIGNASAGGVIMRNRPSGIMS